MSDHFKFQLKPALDDVRVTDKILIERINEAAFVESERQAKQRKTTSSKAPKVNDTQTEMQSSQQNQGITEALVGVQEQAVK